MKRAQEPAGEPSLWLQPLRDRLVEIARRRVSAEAVEDVVQEALAIIHAKGGAVRDEQGKIPAPGSRPPLPWCFRVLRNVIGNLYQKDRTRALAAKAGSEEHARILELFEGRPNPTPLEALEHLDLSRLLDESIRELASGDGECGRILRAALGRGDLGGDGASGAKRSPGSSVATEYVRAFRCRQKLKRILLQRGYRA